MADYFEREYNSLRQGRAKAVAPLQMRVGVPDTVILRITKDSIAWGGVPSIAEVQQRVVDLKVHTFMEAHLEGKNFSITQLVPNAGQARQLVSQDTAAEWVWLVTPERSRSQLLTMTATVVLVSPDKEHFQTFRVMHERIPVKVNLLYTAGQVWSKHWQALAALFGGLATLLGILMKWGQRRTPAHSTPEPPERLPPGDQPAPLPASPRPPAARSSATATGEESAPAPDVLP